MEFHEKLQELRKKKGLTQEELAENLYVSRTAISKWESGKGYPSIDSLKAIAAFFAVTIDDLLSGESLLFIAEKEHLSNMQKVSGLLDGIIDLCSFLLLVLPLYSNTMEEQVYAVNWFRQTQTTVFNHRFVGISSIILILLGMCKILFISINPEKGNKNLYYKVTTWLSLSLGMLLVLFLALMRMPYAIVLAFILFLLKGYLMLKGEK